MANRSNLPSLWSREMSSPMREVSRLQRRLDRMFDEMMSPEMMRGEMIGYVPPCDVSETNTHYLLSFDLPGVSKDDVRIELRDNQLMVSGERREEHEVREGTQRTQERYYGAFQRVIALPIATEPEKIEANYENGVLQIAIPKVEAAKPKQVPIKQEKGGLFGRLIGKEKKEKAA